MTNRPVIEDAPGLAWRKIKKGWMARWQCRSDIAKRGFKPRAAFIWSGAEPDPVATALIQDQCNRLQNQMLIWSRGGIQPVGKFDGTVRSLIDAYKCDKDSNYNRKIRFRSRKHYDSLCARIERDLGSERCENLSARIFLRVHEKWSDGGKLTMAHACIGMCRVLFNYGSTFIEDKECQRVAGILHNLRFATGAPRDAALTAEQADLIRDKAHERGKASMALGQAFQFECLLRQKDVIGEWVPISEPGVSDIHAANNKWLRGLRWEEIDENLVLTHVTSKRGKKLEVPLAKAQMVMQEFDRQYPGSVYWVDVIVNGKVERQQRFARSKLPSSGPVIISEYTRLPWVDEEYRRLWRKFARECGIPDSVRNMDSRAGGITEATDAGAELEHVKHAATHSNIAMTQRYSRGAAKKVETVMDIRAAHRNKTGK